MKLALIVAAILLTGCTHNTAGNETSVVVTSEFGMDAAFAAAGEHCAKYGKVAHLNQVSGYRRVFDCVQR